MTKPCVTIKPDGMISTPHGTVTMVTDLERGVLRVCCEPEPHLADWQAACDYIASVSAGGSSETWADGPVEVFEVALR